MIPLYSYPYWYRRHPHLLKLLHARHIPTCIVAFCLVGYSLMLLVYSFDVMSDPIGISDHMLGYMETLSVVSVRALVVM